MIALLAVLSLAAAPPAPPKIPTPPRDPGTMRTPYADRVLIPQLNGSTSSLDLTALAHQTTKFTVSADVTGVGAVTSTTEAEVIHHLACDPRWRVTVDDGALVAYKRKADGKEWTVDMGGYLTQGASTWRTLLRFEQYESSAPWASSALISRARAEDPSIVMTAFSVPGKNGVQAVALAWEGAEVALEVYEAGTDENLPHVQDALGTVPNLVSGLVRDAATIEQRGFDQLYMPSKEPKRGDPSLEITSPGAGELEIRGHANPGELGYLWVRLDDANLIPWEEAAVAVGTREVVGWSDDDRAQFYFQGRFPVPSGPAFTGTAELWFQPSAGGSARLISAFPTKVPKR